MEGKVDLDARLAIPEFAPFDLITQCDGLHHEEAPAPDLMVLSVTPGLLRTLSEHLRRGGEWGVNALYFSDADAHDRVWWEDIGDDDDSLNLHGTEIGVQPSVEGFWLEATPKHDPQDSVFASRHIRLPDLLEAIAARHQTAVTTDDATTGLAAGERYAWDEGAQRLGYARDPMALLGWHAEMAERRGAQAVTTSAASPRAGRAPGL